MDARVQPGHDGYFVARNPDKQIPGGFPPGICNS